MNTLEAISEGIWKNVLDVLCYFLIYSYLFQCMSHLQFIKKKNAELHKNCRIHFFLIYVIH